MSGLIQQHVLIYGIEPVGVYVAPGRVNLIGEHTDYNDGYVLPTPIKRSIRISANKRNDNRIHLTSLDFDEYASYDLNRFSFDEKHTWANYVLGVIQSLRSRGFSLGGVNACITGDVPIGVGLSSSAALEIAFVRCLDDLFDLGISPVEMAYVGKECENKFVGVQSGIMDQFVSSLGQYGEALFIDCRTNEHSYYSLNDEYRVVIVNSMVDRSLSSSAYNIRYNQCQEAVKIIQKHYPEVKALRDVTEEILSDQWRLLSSLIARRARHVVTENKRVKESIRLLDKGDMSGFGELMYDSHESLRHDYEVSSMELDLLVRYAKDMGIVIGARLTGAGFGGCTVNLVEKEHLDEFSGAIFRKYYNDTGNRCEIYPA